MLDRWRGLRGFFGDRVAPHITSIYADTIIGTGSKSSGVSQRGDDRYARAVEGAE